jgi:aspartate aminotransferase
MAPPDPILSLSVLFKNDQFPQKVNLGVGAYRCDKGKPYIFPVVKKAELMVVQNELLDKEYAPQEGDEEFNRGARGVLFGWDHPDVDSGRVLSI